MSDYDQLADRLVGQLDSLIAFLGISHQEVFDLLRNERGVWLGESAEKIPEAFATYRTHVVHSAFLLGYSYFEGFLTDLLKAILISRPAMLSNDRKISYRDVVEARSRDDILDQIAGREIMDLLYKNMKDIVGDLRKRYGFTVTQEQESEMCRASLIRNCIMHNSSCADSRLGELDGFSEGAAFELRSADVHHYGVVLRNLIRSLVSEANTNHQPGEQAAGDQLPARGEAKAE